MIHFHMYHSFSLLQPACGFYIPKQQYKAPLLLNVQGGL